MERTVIAGTLSKYSMGRSVGIKPQNWKSRYFKLTTQHFTIFDSSETSPVLFECPLSAISLVFAQPTPEIHKECKSSSVMLMFGVRLFENGVFTLLMQASNQEEKARWVQALADTIKEKSKGFQLVE